MDENELKSRLAEMDAAIRAKRGEVEDAQLELKHLGEKRRAFANRNCGHERTYERSCMGKEIDVYCDICGVCLT